MVRIAYTVISNFLFSHKICAKLINKSYFENSFFEPANEKKKGKKSLIIGKLKNVIIPDALQNNH